MRKSLFAASALILLLVMTGCRRNKVLISLPPPPPPPVERPVAIPHATLSDMPQIPQPVPPDIVLGGAVAPAPPKRNLQRSTEPPSTEDAQANKPDALQSATAGEEPPPATPIGDLSAAPNTQGLPSSANIAHEIQWIQSQLAGIHRAMSTKEQHTAAQIRTFLSKATNALQAGDLDGANTLMIKARVLLSEIQ